MFAVKPVALLAIPLALAGCAEDRFRRECSQELARAIDNPIPPVIVRVETLAAIEAHRIETRPQLVESCVQHRLARYEAWLNEPPTHFRSSRYSRSAPSRGWIARLGPSRGRHR